MKRKLFIPLFAILLALSFAACDVSEAPLLPDDKGSDITSSLTDSAEDKGSDITSSLTDSAVSDTTSANQKVDEKKAKEIALNHAGLKESDITNYEIELDRNKKGVSLYDIEFRAGADKYEYDIGVETGNILSAEKNDNNTLEATYKKISKDSAKQKALDHAGVKADSITNYKIEFDVDDGVPSYEIEFHSGGYEYEYDIHSSDGKILKSEKERID